MNDPIRNLSPGCTECQIGKRMFGNPFGLIFGENFSSRDLRVKNLERDFIARDNMAKLGDLFVKNDLITRQPGALLILKIGVAFVQSCGGHAVTALPSSQNLIFTKP